MPFQTPRIERHGPPSRRTFDIVLTEEPSATSPVSLKVAAALQLPKCLADRPFANLPQLCYRHPAPLDDNHFAISRLLYQRAGMPLQIPDACLLHIPIVTHGCVTSRIDLVFRLERPH